MKCVTRLAPSPTGALHLGNARTFLVNWILARQNGWRIDLRIEDLDGPRVKRDADVALIDDLRWLGLNWDTGPTRQSDRTVIYNQHINHLLQAGLAYACICTRKEIELAASAPHAEDGAEVYPGTCRDRFTSIEQAIKETGRTPAIRFRVPPGIVRFSDQICGEIATNVEKQLGDFVIRKADGTAAYQLAVVVDDHAAGVTHIVRGDDLLDSTPRQLLLYRALQFSPEPKYFHLPLVVGTDAKRLAKRHGDTRLGYYRSLGVPPARMLALLARWSGVACGDETSIQEILDRFTPAGLPRDRIIFTGDDDAFLRSAC